MLDLKKLAKKANGGDREALTILVLEMPGGAMGDMKPKEFAKKMDEEDSFSEYVDKQDRPSKDSYSAYEDDDMDEDVEDGGTLEEGVMSLLESWTERDPDTPAGMYYQELKELCDKHCE